jgi:hypothetical protein
MNCPHLLSPLFFAILYFINLWFAPWQARPTCFDENTPSSYLTQID